MIASVEWTGLITVIWIDLDLLYWVAFIQNSNYQL